MEIDEQVEVFAQRDVYAGVDAGDGYPDRAFQATAGPARDSSVPQRFGAFGLRPIPEYFRAAPLLGCGPYQATTLPLADAHGSGGLVQLATGFQAARPRIGRLAE